MKQNEVKAVALLDGVAVLRELSNNPLDKVPSLTIVIPYRPPYNGEGATPPMSVQLSATETEALFNFLAEYYSKL